MRRLALLLVMLVSCGSETDPETAASPTTSLSISPSVSPTPSPSPTPPPSPTPSPTPDVVLLTGHLTTTYIHPGGCDEIRTASDAIALLARSFVARVENKVIRFRSETGRVLGTATTAGFPALKRTPEKSGKYPICLAISDFEVQLPYSEEYLITVAGNPVAPDPVTYDELTIRGFECNLHIHTDGRLLGEEPCTGGNWVDTYFPDL